MKKGMLVLSWFGILIAAIVSGCALTALAQTVVYSNGVLYQAGVPNPSAKESNPGWATNQFSCGSGTPTFYHYDDDSSNNTGWYACTNTANSDTSYGVGALSQGGISNIASKESNSGWKNNLFSCDSGYTLQEYHFDDHSSNNAIFMMCIISSQAKSTPTGTGPQTPPAYDDGGVFMSNTGNTNSL